MLSNEIKSLKKQIPQLLQKNEHDDELIEALMVSVKPFPTYMKSAADDFENVYLKIRKICIIVGVITEKK